MLTSARRRIRTASGRRLVFTMDRDLLVAVAHFPDRGHAIHELARTNEEFRSLCVDLAEAEAALRRWAQSSSPLKEARSTEYKDLVRDLAAELEATLDRYR